MARDEYGRLSGYGSHRDKRLKREQNLLHRLYDEELEDFDGDLDSSDTVERNETSVVFRSKDQ